MLSVVIPTLNSASTISLTLKSIFNNDFPRGLFEVIVVDNGSSDGTVEVARRYPVKVFHCPKRGIGPPRNLGARMAEGDILCFTDSDCIVERDWLRKILSFFEENPEADGVGGPVLPYPCSQNKVQRLTGELFVEDQGYPKEVTKVKFGSTHGIIFGANSAYKKKALLSVGGYSEPGGSNLELAWRLILKGWNLFFNPEIRVYHIFPTSLKSIIKQQFRWGAQSTEMKIIYKLDKGLKELIYIIYFPLRQFIYIFYPREFEKKILHLFQLVSFNLGRIYGFCLPYVKRLDVSSW